MPRSARTGANAEKRSGRNSEAIPSSGDDAPEGVAFEFDSPDETGQFPADGDGKSPLEVIVWFRAQLASGASWHRALLEAIGRWAVAEESHNDRRYKYMVGREAFDWLLLAERLCAEAREYIPTGDLERLLFHGELPELLEENELRGLMGVSKYRAYLNFHYGVVLEEALQLTAEEYARKLHMARGYSDSEDLVDDAFRHLYTDSRTDLLGKFRDEAKLGKREGLTLHDLKEFTYWLHKRRLNYWDPARVASDTRQAILRLEALRETTASSSQSQ